ncbi:hypothetical protein ACVS9P_03550 [Caproicibacterium sp. NSD3]
MKMTFNSSGLDELQERLERASNISDTISFEELFNNSFVHEHSTFSSLEELLKSGGYNTDRESFKKIPNDELDKFIKKSTDFDSWKDMQQSAANEWMSKQLGL